MAREPGSSGYVLMDSGRTPRAVLAIEQDKPLLQMVDDRGKILFTKP
jgi:hypothetical protein